MTTAATSTASSVALTADTTAVADELEKRKEDADVSYMASTRWATWCFHDIGIQENFNTDESMTLFRSLLQSHRTVGEADLAEKPSSVTRVCSEVADLEKENCNLVDGAEEGTVFMQERPATLESACDSAVETPIASGVRTQHAEDSEQIPAFATIEAILRSDWKKENARMERRKWNANASRRRYNNDTSAVSEDSQEDVKQARTAQNAAAAQCNTNACIERKSVHHVGVQVGESLLLNKSPETSQIPNQMRWQFSYACTSCGHPVLLGPESARCIVCVNQDVQLSRGLKYMNSSKGDLVGEQCPVTATKNNGGAENTRNTAHSFLAEKVPSGPHRTRQEKTGPEQAAFVQLLLPPIVPVSAALAFASPETVRFWRRYSRRTKESKPAENLGRMSLATVLPAPSRCMRAKKLPDEKCLDFEDFLGENDLGIAASSEDEEERAYQTISDVHIRAQLTCLSERESYSEACAPTCWRPYAHRLVATVGKMLRAVPPEKYEAFLELLLSWFYAGFFSGKLSMCPS